MFEKFFARIRWMGKCLESLATMGIMIFLPIMVVLIASQVFFRYVLYRPIFWAEELSRYLMVWVAFLGADVALRKNDHAKVTFAISYLSKQNLKRLQIIGLALIVFFTGFVAYYGFKVIQVIHDTNQASPALGMSMVIPYLAVPVGCILIFFHAIESIISIFRDEGSSTNCAYGKKGNGR